MAVFRDFKKEGIDRSAGDRRRHRELVRKSIRENVGHVISEESIIGQSGDKRVKVPIRGIKEYRFIYGENAPGVGQGDGDSEPGQVVQKGKENARGMPGEPGSDPGEDIYETEVTMEELIDLLFEDLNLPDMERKRFHILESERLIKTKGYRIKGIRPRLSKKKSLVQKIKRKQSIERGRDPSAEEREPPGWPLPALAIMVMMWRRSFLAISLSSSKERGLAFADSLEELASAVAFNAEAEEPDGLRLGFGAGTVHPSSALFIIS